MLFIRTVIMIAVTFYTTRILLNYLGVEDYGIYNVLMGVITMFSFISTSMTVATQRFISFELGQNNIDKVKHVFSASIYIYIFIIILSLILFETIGLWYVNNFINVPDERIKAAYYVYQLVIVQFVFLTFRIPYNAVVIAYEKMNFYAYVSIIEALISLLLCYFLLIIDFDKLIAYSVLLSFSKFLILLIYIAYCKKIAKDCVIVPLKKNQISTFKEIWTFSGWNIFGSLAISANNHGINLVINYFSGVVVNASVGISSQLTMGLYNLISNLQTAFNPQIIKLYAAKEYELCRMLIYRNSRFCYYLFILISIPLFICINYVVNLWLGKDCVYAVEFSRCMLLYLAIDSIAYPLSVAIQADGNIQKYQIKSGLLFLILIPLSVLFYKLGISPLWIFIARIFQNIVLTIIRYLYLKSLGKINLKEYFYNVVFRCVIVTLPSFVIPFYFYHFLNESFFSLCILSTISIVVTIISVFCFGVTTNERKSIVVKFCNYMNRN